MKSKLTIFIAVLFITLWSLSINAQTIISNHGQNYFSKENGKFTSNKISVLNISNDKISIQVHYISSLKCACEENIMLDINKNDKGEFIYEIYENTKNTLKINLENNKVNSIEVINNEDFDCCSIITGRYFLKP